MTPPDRNGIAVVRALIAACDYRIVPVGLERGDGCGCNPAVVCLRGRGTFRDAPHLVDYGTCVTCVTPSATVDPIPLRESP